MSTVHARRELVYAFPGGDNRAHDVLGPVVIGHYWIRPSRTSGLIALDVTHPEKPVEVVTAHT